MINVALLSRWHVHADEYAEQAQNNPDLSIKMVWDENETRGREWGQSLGVPFEQDLHAVLTNDSIDAVIVASPTSMHKDIMMAAARNKKHIFSEKVLAITVQDAREILQAVKENEVLLTLSLPRLTAPYYLYAQQVMDQGLLGKLTTVRCRVAHNGAVKTEENPHGWLPQHFYNKEQCGGGAFIDLGAHPIYLTNRLAGNVRAVTARLQTHGHDVDVNSAVLVEYDSGALGILETGFVSSGSPFQLELYGTEGTLLIEDSKVKIRTQQSREWKIPEMPESIAMPIDQWARALVSGKQPDITLEDAFNLTLVNELAAISNREGRRLESAELLTKI
ncbi:Gfo/Idh/MocA family protein [Peribacillus deserti]|uniref:Gfo/Idh/MocA family oxidoreductase n=1 Tax=Peribacillus deserti TaxID=673318 RepID=A0A2N5M4X6_9BACI|nr:Gfo/Idh/MocA family oxidoreductase [Peribacillus deserti]PLT29410.1 gfo/Idh/MocA family oxidoreductase [Peribacillus deserti]